jgi:uncharacterized membrane protein
MFALPPMPTSESDSFEILRIYDAKFLMVATILCGGYTIAALLFGGIVQFVLGLFVVLAAPGYAASALLFGRGSRLPLSVHIALIVGLTVVIEVSVGILYYAGSHGILALNAALGLLATVLCLVATLVQGDRGVALALAPVSGAIRKAVELRGFSSGQRAVAFALFAAILVTFGVIGYLSTIHPDGQPLLSIAALGPDGTTSTLPIGGSPNQTLEVIIAIGNDATAQSLNLSVQSALSGSSESIGSTISWTMPLHLASGTQSSDTFTLAAGATESIPITFLFSVPGDYAVTFTLQAPGGAAPVTVIVGEAIA